MNAKKKKEGNLNEDCKYLLPHFFQHTKKIFLHNALLSFAALTINLKRSANSCFRFSLLLKVAADWLSLAVFKDANSMSIYLLTPCDTS